MMLGAGLGSPTVLAKRGFRFVIYLNEADTESPHVHVVRGKGNRATSAKFWLRPVTLADNHGFSGVDLRRAREELEDHLSMILEQWHAIKTRKR